MSTLACLLASLLLLQCALPGRAQCLAVLAKQGAAIPAPPQQQAEQQGRFAQVTGHQGAESLPEALKDADLVIIPAGVPRKPGMTRDDLFNINASIVQSLAEGIAKHCPKVWVAGVLLCPGCGDEACCSHASASMWGAQHIGIIANGQGQHMKTEASHTCSSEHGLL